MTESNAQFIARMSRQESMIVAPLDFNRLIALAEERVMIEEHRIMVMRDRDDETWLAWASKKSMTDVQNEDFSTAIRSVVAKIGEGNG